VNAHLEILGHGEVMAQETPPNPHVSYLDSIRGLAALTVINCHYVESHDLPCRGMFCDYLLSETMLHLWWDGQAAVTLFFVLSGLVLSLRYFQHAHPPTLSVAALARYVISRIFRIWPPYLVALGISAAAYDHYQEMALSLPDTVPKQNDWIP
jgi:peptidoglycan/LPS O-acetylase OafA/YrhL